MSIVNSIIKEFIKPHTFSAECRRRVEKMGFIKTGKFAFGQWINSTGKFRPKNKELCFDLMKKDIDDNSIRNCWISRGCSG